MNDDLNRYRGANTGIPSQHTDHYANVDHGQIGQYTPTSTYGTPSSVNGTNHRTFRQTDNPVPHIAIHDRNIYKPYILNPAERDELRNKYGKDPLLLIFSKSSCEKLKGFLGWGMHCRENLVEQGGVLIGKVNRFQHEIYSFVEDVILANTNGSSAFVEFTPDMWAKMQQELSTINEKNFKQNKLSIIGWFHTHPNGLSVFMSGTDMNTQSKNFSQDWQVSLVLNPHQQKLSAFFGKAVKVGTIIGWSQNNHMNRPLNDFQQSSRLPSNTSYSAEEVEKLVQKAVKEAVYKTENKTIQKIKALKEVFIIKTRHIRIIWGFTLAIVFVVALTIGQIWGMHNAPEIEDENSEIQSYSSATVILPKTSEVFIYITCEKWTSIDSSVVANIFSLNSIAQNYKRTQKLVCNSSNTMLELEAGTYKITFSLPTLKDGTTFEEVEPLYLTVNGVNSKFIPIQLQEAKGEIPTSSETHEESTENETTEGESTESQSITSTMNSYTQNHDTLSEVDD